MKALRRKAATKAATKGGAAQASVDLSSTAPSSSPDLPHEQDEGTGVTGGVPSARVQQGGRDVKRGVQDTSRAPEADSAYRKLKQT